jgi:hypothetical protein
LEQITPTRQQGVVPPPPDYQYDEPRQPTKPINFENRNDEDDLRNVYNPNKKANFWPSSSEDRRHAGHNGLSQITPQRQ